jgi:hypothetical protein
MPTTQNPRRLPFYSLQIVREAASSLALQTALRRIRIHIQPKNVEGQTGPCTNVVEVG